MSTDVYKVTFFFYLDGHITKNVSKEEPTKIFNANEK